MAHEKSVELRIRVIRPVAGALGGVQIGSGASAEVPEWHEMSGDDHVFATSALAKDGNLPLRGPAVQKDGKGRFVYLVSRGGPINRRAKIYLESITQPQVDAGSPLTIEISGQAKDGLPCCASIVPIRDWS